MKIVHVIDDLSCGGAEKACVELCNYLAEYHEVFLVCLNGDANPAGIFFREKVDQRIKTLFLNKKEGVDRGIFYHLFKVLKRIHPDVINMHLGGLFYAAPYLVLQRKVISIYTIHSLHALDKNNKRRLFYKALLKFRSLYFVANSEIVMRYNKDILNLTRYSFIHLGIKNMCLSEDSQKVLQEINSYKYNTSVRVLISVARLRRVKNQVLLLKAFKHLISWGYEAILLVVGGEEDTLYFREVEPLLSAGIYYLGEKNNVADYLSVADIFCLTSDHEGLSIATVEAMSMGVLPVCTPAGGVIDIVKNGYNGFISDDHTEEKYVDALRKALDLNVDKKMRLLQNAFRTYQEYFTIEKCGQGYLELYKTMMNDN